MIFIKQGLNWTQASAYYNTRHSAPFSASLTNQMRQRFELLKSYAPKVWITASQGLQPLRDSRSSHWTAFAGEVDLHLNTWQAIFETLHSGFLVTTHDWLEMKCTDCVTTFDPGKWLQLIQN